MNPAATNNVNASDGTSPERRNLFENESTLAYAAVLRQLDEIKVRLQPRNNLAGLVTRYPLASAAAVTAIGYLAGRAVLPIGKRQDPAEGESQSDRAQNKEGGRPPWWSALVGPVLEVVKVLTERQLINAISRAASSAPTKAGRTHADVFSDHEASPSRQA